MVASRCRNLIDHAKSRSFKETFYKITNSSKISRSRKMRNDCCVYGKDYFSILRNTYHHE
jgi:hypothetical protein